MTNFSGLVSVLGLLALASSCAGAAPRGASAARTSDRLWVLAPHPDDEVLMAGELLLQAVASRRPVSVLVMTNGDLGCERNGYVREAETIAALAILGVREEDVHFLGYPDGFLELLGDTPLEPLARAQPDGSCGVGTGTYAARGSGRADLHTQLFGAPGPYVAEGPVSDLAELLARERPSQIVVAHPIDTHPDHAMTYVFLHRALERAQLTLAPTILRAVVHQGPCWPNGAGDEPCPDIRASFGSPMPSFAAPLETYVPSLRISSADAGLTKRRAIAAYLSQLGTPIADESWLSSFARTDEVFWPVALTRDADHADRLVRAPDGPVRVVAADVALAPGGSAFFEVAAIRVGVDGDGITLSHQGTELRRMQWARGLQSVGQHTFELRVDGRPNEGGVAEITLRRAGALSLLAVISGVFDALTGEQVSSGADRGTIDVGESPAE